MIEESSKSIPKLLEFTTKQLLLSTEEINILKSYEVYGNKLNNELIQYNLELGQLLNIPNEETIHILTQCFFVRGQLDQIIQKIQKHFQQKANKDSLLKDQISVDLLKNHIMKNEIQYQAKREELKLCTNVLELDSIQFEQQNQISRKIKELAVEFRDQKQQQFSNVKILELMNQINEIFQINEDNRQLNNLNELNILTEQEINQFNEIMQKKIENVLFIQQQNYDKIIFYATIFNNLKYLQQYINQVILQKIQKQSTEKDKIKDLCNQYKSLDSQIRKQNLIQISINDIDMIIDNEQKIYQQLMKRVESNNFIELSILVSNSLQNKFGYMFVLILFDIICRKFNIEVKILKNYLIANYQQNEQLLNNLTCITDIELQLQLQGNFEQINSFTSRITMEMSKWMQQLKLNYTAINKSINKGINVFELQPQEYLMYFFGQDNIAQQLEQKFIFTPNKSVSFTQDENIQQFIVRQESLNGIQTLEINNKNMMDFITVIINIMQLHKDAYTQKIQYFKQIVKQYLQDRDKNLICQYLIQENEYDSQIQITIMLISLLIQNQLGTLIQYYIQYSIDNLKQYLQYYTLYDFVIDKLLIFNKYNVKVNIVNKQWMDFIYSKLLPINATTTQRQQIESIKLYYQIDQSKDTSTPLQLLQMITQSLEQKFKLVNLQNYDQIIRSFPYMNNLVSFKFIHHYVQIKYANKEQILKQIIILFYLQNKQYQIFTFDQIFQDQMLQQIEQIYQEILSQIKIDEIKVEQLIPLDSTYQEIQQSIQKQQIKQVIIKMFFSEGRSKQRINYVWELIELCEKEDDNKQLIEDKEYLIQNFQNQQQTDYQIEYFCKNINKIAKVLKENLYKQQILINNVLQQKYQHPQLLFILENVEIQEEKQTISLAIQNEKMFLEQISNQQVNRILLNQITKQIQSGQQVIYIIYLISIYLQMNFNDLCNILQDWLKYQEFELYKIQTIEYVYNIINQCYGMNLDLLQKERITFLNQNEFDKEEKLDKDILYTIFNKNDIIRLLFVFLYQQNDQKINIQIHQLANMNIDQKFEECLNMCNQQEIQQKFIKYLYNPKIKNCFININDRDVNSINNINIQFIQIDIKPGIFLNSFKFNNSKEQKSKIQQIRQQRFDQLCNQIQNQSGQIQQVNYIQSMLKQTNQTYLRQQQPKIEVNINKEQLYNVQYDYFQQSILKPKQKILRFKNILQTYQDSIKDKEQIQQDQDIELFIDYYQPDNLDDVHIQFDSINCRYCNIENNTHKMVEISYYDNYIYICETQLDKIYQLQYMKDTCKDIFREQLNEKYQKQIDFIINQQNLPEYYILKNQFFYSSCEWIDILLQSQIVQELLTQNKLDQFWADTKNSVILCQNKQVLTNKNISLLYILLLIVQKIKVIGGKYECSYCQKEVKVSQLFKYMTNQFTSLCSSCYNEQFK